MRLAKYSRYQRIPGKGASCLPLRWISIKEESILSGSASAKHGHRARQCWHQMDQNYKIFPRQYMSQSSNLLVRRRPQQNAFNAPPANMAAELRRVSEPLFFHSVDFFKLQGRWIDTSPCFAVRACNSNYLSIIVRKTQIPLLAGCLSFAFRACKYGGRRRQKANTSLVPSNL